LRVALVGCGQIARSVHLPNLSRLGVEVAALCDPSRQALQAAGLQAPTFTSLESMLEHSGVEAAIITSPPAYHASQALACLKAGLHVYIEKPLAANLEEAEALVQAAQETRLVTAVGFNLRFHPLFEQMRRLIAAGQIGKITAIRSVFSSAAPLASCWRRGQGGGALLELGSHHFDLVRYLTGQEITAIQHETSDDGVQAWSLATLAQGGRYQGFFSLDCADDERFEVYGEQGRLSLQRYASAEVEVHPRSGHRLRWRRLASLLRSPLHLGYVLNKFRSPNHEPSYLPCLRAFLAACQGVGAWSGASPGDGLAALRCSLGRLSTSV